MVGTNTKQAAYGHHRIKANKLKWYSGKDQPPEHGKIVFLKYKRKLYVGEVEEDRVLCGDFDTVDDREEGVPVRKIQWRPIEDVAALFED